MISKDSSLTTQLTTLLHTHILSLLPTARCHAYMCSSGSKGYHALKEMLQNGKPGNTLLLEGGDLRDVKPLTVARNPATKPKKGTLNDNHGVRTYRGNTTPSQHVCILSNICPTNKHLEFRSSRDAIEGQLLRVGLNSIIVLTNASVLPSSYLPSGLPNLVSITFNFPLRHVTELQCNFLGDCSGLKSIDLSPFVSITEIGRSFMTGCSRLTSIDLSPFSQLTSISWGFMKGCSGLTSIDLSPLSQVTYIDMDCLSGCSGLTTVTMTKFPKLTTIKSHFMQGCTCLPSIDLSAFSEVITIGPCPFQGCTNLTTIDMTPLVAMSSIPTNLLGMAYRTIVLPEHIIRAVMSGNGSSVVYASGSSAFNYR